MKKGLVIGLSIGGGLALLTGGFFLVKSLMKKKDETGTGAADPMMGSGAADPTGGSGGPVATSRLLQVSAPASFSQFKDYTSIALMYGREIPAGSVEVGDTVNIEEGRYTGTYTIEQIGKRDGKIGYVNVFNKDLTVKPHNTDKKAVFSADLAKNRYAKDSDTSVRLNKVSFSKA